MNIHTIYSESHEGLYEKFKDSLDGRWFSLRARQSSQVCESGEYGSKDAIQFWKEKTKYILEILDRESRPFLYSDVDVHIVKDFTKDLKLGQKDIVFQLDKYLWGIRPTICAGFMYMKPNNSVKQMFEWVLKNLEKYGDDQKAINRYLIWRKIKWGVLPKTYYSIGFDNGGKIWNGEEVKIKNRDYYIIHLNYTTGIKNKLELLNYFQLHKDDRSDYSADMNHDFHIKW